MREIGPARERKIYEVTSANNPSGKVPRNLSKREREAEVELRVEDGRTDIQLRKHSAYFTYSIVVLNTVSTLAILFLCGFGLMKLSNAVLGALIAETLGAVGTVFITMNRYLFPPR
jgi:hypothetical protein